MPSKKIINQPTPSKRFAVKFILALLTFGFILLAGFTIHKNLYSQSEPAPTNQTESPQVTEQKPAVIPDQEAPKALPSKLSLKVPFTPQAPTANWDELHNEACEEASSIMTYAYFNNIPELPPKFVEDEIKRITEWETENFGYYLDINTEETAELLEKFYDLKTDVVDLSEQTIKQALSENKLVIYAANGQKLGNPYFRPPGPPYHMLVITGYDETGFLANDPGTRRGQNYKYTYDTLYNAGGDWSHNTHSVDLGNKKIIIVTK